MPKTCFLLNKLMNEAISWQISQIYNTLSSVPWRDRRDKTAYSWKDTFCLGSQPFRATSCRKLALYRVVLTATVAAEGELWKQSLASDNEGWSITRKHREARGAVVFHFHIGYLCEESSEADRRPPSVHEKSEKACKQKRKVLLRHKPCQGAFGSITLFKSRWLRT